jgi:hypothetical protein
VPLPLLFPIGSSSSAPPASIRCRRYARWATASSTAEPPSFCAREPPLCRAPPRAIVIRKKPRSRQPLLHHPSLGAPPRGWPSPSVLRPCLHIPELHLTAVVLAQPSRRIANHRMPASPLFPLDRRVTTGSHLW